MSDQSRLLLQFGDEHCTFPFANLPNRETFRRPIFFSRGQRRENGLLSSMYVTENGKELQESPRMGTIRMTDRL